MSSPFRQSSRWTSRELKGWTNKLIWGDNKLILSSLKNGPLREEIERQGGLKRIHIDPPFDVGADFSMNIEIPSSFPPDKGGKRGVETFTKKPHIPEEIAYRDTWGKGADSFLAMICERLALMPVLPAEDGSIYVHRNLRVHHHLREVLDEVEDDIPPVNPQAKERVDHPTQKSEALLERITKASSNEGGLVAVKPTDFSVFYSQDSIAAVEATLKDKASKIVVEKGHTVKVSKDAKGITKREVLTKNCTDWIDYWAVYFNLESKREIIRVKNEESGAWEERWTGDCIFENEWQSYRTKKNRNLELKSVFHGCTPGRR